MIIFYDKITGKISGIIEGRIHPEHHLKMNLGNNERLIVQWKPIKWYSKDGKIIDKDSKDIFTADFEPDHIQKDLFIKLDRKSNEVYKYKVNIITKNLTHQ